MGGLRRRDDRGVPGRRAPFLRHPAQVVVAAFAAAVAVGTILLMLPVARAGPGSASLLEAAFTATSAVCVTGLVMVDTPTYWSTFGEVVILGLIQVGGFGIMTLTSLLVVIVARRIGLRSRLTAAVESNTFGIGDVRTVLLGVAKVSVTVELAVAAILTARLATAYDEPFGRAVYLGVFHAVAAFNNSGVSLYSDNFMRFVTDPWVGLPVCVAIIVGGIGFPVLLELRRELRRPWRWSLHTKITVWATGVLLVGGTAFVAISEWGNPETLRPLDVPGRLLAAFFHAVNTRNAGFNSLDVAQMTEGTWLGTDVLMFIGGGSASTAGGIKVTTFALLLFVIIAEIRGEESVHAFDRKVSPRAQRQALTVALLSVAVVVIPTLVILETTDIALDRVLFEVVSAFSTTGLSTGITADLPAGAQAVIMVLMFIGRLGPITFASALALRHRARRYDLPEARPIIG